MNIDVPTIFCFGSAALIALVEVWPRYNKTLLSFRAGGFV